MFQIRPLPDSLATLELLVFKSSLKRWMQHFAVCVSILALSACGSSEALGVAEEEVIRFHKAFNAETLSEYYDSHAEDLEKSGGKLAFMAFIEKVRQKLGSYKEAKRGAWNVTVQANGNFVTLQYETSFSNGLATEEFVFHVAKQEARLVGYHLVPGVIKGTRLQGPVISFVCEA